VVPSISHDLTLVLFLILLGEAQQPGGASSNCSAYAPLWFSGVTTPFVTLFMECPETSCLIQGERR